MRRESVTVAEGCGPRDLDLSPAAPPEREAGAGASAREGWGRLLSGYLAQR